MPTIDELPAAVSVSDTDELVVSQSDIARKATRAQLLSGVQPALALPQNALLGRYSAGTGAPQSITIGPNLTVSNGIISAPPPFVISTLPAAGLPQANDLVAVAQGGQNAAANYSAFMGGLSVVSGINGSNLLVSPTGGVGARRIADILSDAISIESFGAVGDGITDDTSAFLTAAQSGRPIRLDGRVYILNGPILLSNATSIVGVAGMSTLRRLEITSLQPWIEIAGPSLVAIGVTFDANGLAALDSPVVQVDASCLRSEFTYCQFINAIGAATGNGALLNLGNGATHKFTNCAFLNNARNGIAASGNGTISIGNSLASGNLAAGIAVAQGVGYNIRDNECSTNLIGISIGAWQGGTLNVGAPTESIVDGNYCIANTTWGIAIGAYAASVRSNLCTSNGSFGAGGGIVARITASCVMGNMVSGSIVGIDARTSLGSLINGNVITNSNTGMLVGGCQDVAISDNFLVMNQWGIIISAVEPGLSLSLTGPISIDGNWIGFTTALGGGINLQDGALGISITKNDFNGSGSAGIGQSLWLNTTQAIVNGNTWNNLPQFIVQTGIVAGVSTLIVPDVADDVVVSASENPILSLLTTHQADTLGQITLIRVISGGAGYTRAEVAISGLGGGAAAQAIVNQGQVICIVVTNPGSGYGAIGTEAVATISGDGNGCAATAYVGLPVLNGRRLRIGCNTTVQLAVTGTSPPQQNWTDFAVTVPAFGAIEMEGMFGAWRAVSFPAIDYVLPTGNGGAVLQTVAGGDLTLRPSAAGKLYIASAAEPAGCTSSVGRGAPTGTVSAPPGSDFRNLNGGPGDTFWIKQTGTDATGWVAVA